jgi:hypothetical protein
MVNAASKRRLSNCDEDEVGVFHSGTVITSRLLLDRLVHSRIAAAFFRSPARAVGAARPALEYWPTLRNREWALSYLRAECRVITSLRKMPEAPFVART